MKTQGLELLVSALLARHGVVEYRGPRGLIAGYPHDSVPEDLVAEWEELFGAFRNRLLAPLARSPEADGVQPEIQRRDRAAAEMANREMRRRYGGPRKLPRRETRRELAGPNYERAQ